MKNLILIVLLFICCKPQVVQYEGEIDPDIVGFWYAEEFVYNINDSSIFINGRDSTYPSYSLALKEDMTYRQRDPGGNYKNGIWYAVDNCLYLDGILFVNYERIEYTMFLYTNNWYGFNDCRIRMSIMKDK